MTLVQPIAPVTRGKTQSLRRVGRGAVMGVLGAGAASVAFSGQAHADTLGDALDAVTPNADVAPQVPVPEAPALPDLPQMLDDFMQDVQGVAPSNLLRTRSGGGDDAAEAAPVSAGHVMTPHADTVSVPEGAVANALNEAPVHNFIDNAFPEVQSISDSLLAEHNAEVNDPNAIGQAFGTFQQPTSETITQMQSDAQALFDNVVSGKALNDVREAIDNTLASQEFTAWQNNNANVGAVDNTLRGVDRGAAGVAALIDQVTVDPMGAFDTLLSAAGGPIRLLTDPIGGIVSAAAQVFGPDLMSEARDFLNTVPGAITDSLREALPALLAIPAGGLIGSLLGAPLGALPGAGIGAVLGALNPLNLLIGGLPGAILGGLATGIPGAIAGFIGTALATLPLLTALPLMGAAGASALALVAAATVIFGVWLLSVIPAAIVMGVIGIVLGLVVAVLGVVLTLGNPTMALAAIGAGVAVAFVFFLLGTAAYMALTVGIPVLAFLVIAPILMLGSAGLGALAGLLLGALIAGITIPLGTLFFGLLSALPGAVIGGLLGTAIASIINSLIGAAIGGLIGAVIGGLVGGVLGSLLGAAIGIPLFVALALTNIGDWWSSVNEDPNSALNHMRQAMDRGWRESALGALFGRFESELWNTDSGQRLGDLLNRVNGLFQTMAFLDGRRLREMLMRGALLGGAIGAPLGAIPGGLLGALLGALSPLNLLTGGLPGAIAGAIPGGLLGAAAGKGLSFLLGALTTLIATPLLVVPNLIVFGLGWLAWTAVSTLAALAAAILPPIALGIAAGVVGGLIVTSPLWIPLTIISALATIVTFVAFGVVAWAAIIPPLLPFAAVAGIVATVAGITAAVLAPINVLVLLVGIVGGLLTIGIATALLTAPLFVFPALLVPLLNALALPSLLPMALGASLLEGLSLGMAVDNISSLLTVPVGALIGAGLGALAGGTIGTLVNALVRALVYGAGGALAGAAVGFLTGGVLGAIAALLTHLRIDVGTDLRGVNPTHWIDGRIVNRGGFGDILADVIPGLSGEKRAVGFAPHAAPAEMKAVPQVASPGVAFTPNTGGRELVDATALVAA